MIKKIKKALLCLVLCTCITACKETEATIVEDYNKNLGELILDSNEVKREFDLKLTSVDNQTDGLFATNDTNGNRTTYFFRGKVDNNYIVFADLKWRIVRINEDGTIKLIMENGITSNTGYNFNENTEDYNKMYYKNSLAESTLNKWYENTLKDYDDNIVEGNFCTDFKVVSSYFEQINGISTTLYQNYTPTLRCNNVLKSKIGLLTIDEVSYAGAFYRMPNETYYLNNNQFFWTMSPAGFEKKYADTYEWIIGKTGELNIYDVSDGENYKVVLRPVINLKKDTIAISGNGTFNAPYRIKTN